MGHYGPFSVQASLKAQQNHSWPGGTGPVFLADSWGLLTREHLVYVGLGSYGLSSCMRTAGGGGSGSLRLGNLGLRLC